MTARQQKTFSVTIPAEHEAELTDWVARKGGRTEPEPRFITGNHGYLYVSGRNWSLDFYLRMFTAATNPEMECPSLSDMPTEVLMDLLQQGTDSYDWMNEGRFDEPEQPELQATLQPVLRARTPLEPEQASQMTGYLQSLGLPQEMPDWQSMSPAQQALVQETFRHSAEWRTEQRLHSADLESLAAMLRKTSPAA